MKAKDLIGGALPVLGKLLLGKKNKGMSVPQNPRDAMEEGKVRIAAGPQVTKMKKGGMVKKGYHKMPDGKMMKNSAHKKMTKKSTASKRADGICKKGKTRGRMC
jgi:hypothetical protein